jgi:serine/threonine protein kinase/tetratricopeptide (TPR) repeat protein
VDQATGSGSTSVASADRLQIAGYDILEELGRGAMGVVYKARQRGLKRIVALKMILAGGHASPRDLARFKSEAEAVAQLQHPNIVQIYEVGTDDGRPFFSLEFVDGGSLDRRIAGTPQLPLPCADVVRKAALAMEYAHQRGVVHRDLKPSNILLVVTPTAGSSATPPSTVQRRSATVASGDGAGMAIDPILGLGEPKITDFGLAKRLDDDSGQTHSGAILGTPSYMSPEQADGRIRDVGPLSDVWALGAILYDLITGRPPFRSATVADTLQMVRKQEPVPPTQLQPRTPRDLETICLKCLQKDPASRYGSAAALADDLRRFLAGEPIKARPVSARERLWRWCRRNPRVAVLSGAVALLLVVWATTSSLLYAQIRAEQAETVKQRNKAVENADIAADNERKARDEEAKAKGETKRANDNAARAERNLDFSRTKLSQAMLRTKGMTERVHDRLRSLTAQSDDPRWPQAEEALIKFAGDTLFAMGTDARDAGVSPFAQVLGMQLKADLYARAGRFDEAMIDYQKAVQLIRQLPDSESNWHGIRANAASLLGNDISAVLLDRYGDTAGALVPCLEARKLQQDVLERPNSIYPVLTSKRLIANFDVRLARTYLSAGDPVTARKYAEEAREFRDLVADAAQRSVAAPGPGVTPAAAAANRNSARSLAAEAYLVLGICCWHLHDAAAAHDAFNKAVAIAEDLAKVAPGSASYQADLGELYLARGEAKLRLGDADAGKDFTVALKHFNVATRLNPDAIGHHFSLALTHDRLGSLGGDDAARHFDAAHSLRAQLARMEPKNLRYQMAVPISLVRCKKPAAAVARAEDLAPSVAKSPELKLQMAIVYAQSAAASNFPERALLTGRALETLESLAALDFKDSMVLESDPDLASLRDQERFKAVVMRIKNNK